MATMTRRGRAQLGRQARRRAPRSGHARWQAGPDRTPALDLLAARDAERVADLLPIRYGRMAASPFAFFRGAATVMASDLAGLSRTGLRVQLCGDAHLLNFGMFTSPERVELFDVNDFDETLPGPFEWDVKRLAASVEVAARSRAFSRAARRAAVTKTVRSYRETMHELARMPNLEIYYARLDLGSIAERWGKGAPRRFAGAFERPAERAEATDQLDALATLITEHDGELRFVNRPPLLVRAEELPPDASPARSRDRLLEAFGSYQRTLSSDRQLLFRRYRLVDVARKVVGVGSVGARCWVALFVGRDNLDPLVLQLKEASGAAGAAYLGVSRYPNAGQRVVEGQRLMQGASDIFLGWDRIDGGDGHRRDFYVRQLWDGKGSADVALMSPRALAVYGRICGWTLARAHARSGDPIALAAYLGTGSNFERALAEFGSTYADQNERDHAALVEAISSGAVAAPRDV